MTGRPAFGELLCAARRHLTGQPGLPAPGRGDVGEVSRSLLRVVIILSRYLHDTATAVSDQPASAPAPPVAAPTTHRGRWPSPASG